MKSTRGELPLLAGILNVTPDSFYDGQTHFPIESAIHRGKELAEQGANWIDIGGESTRPGATPVDAKEECARVIPVIEALSKTLSIPISIDTMKASVASAALEAGATIVNDVSGLRADPEMAAVVAQSGAEVVLNHMRGNPQSMQQSPHYEDVIQEVKQELTESVEIALKAGIAKNKIYLDPGIGFGKRLEDNLTLLARLPELQSLGFPLFVGVSRKSFLGKILDGKNAQERLMGTAAAVSLAVWGGAKVLRVHDVTEMKDVLRVSAAIAQCRTK